MFLITLLTFLGGFLIPIIFSNLNCNCSIIVDLRNLQEQVKKAVCYQKLFWPLTVWINCSSNLKNLAKFSAFKSFSFLQEQFFLTAGHNNFDNKIPLNFEITASKTTRLSYLASILSDAAAQQCITTSFQRRTTVLPVTIWILVIPLPFPLETPMTPNSNPNMVPCREKPH